MPLTRELAPVSLVLEVLLLTGCVAGEVPKREADMSFAHVVASAGEGDARVLSLKVDPSVHKRVIGPMTKYEGPYWASVRVDADTQILMGTALGNRRATLDEVVDATYLNVWFRGSVTEPGPVQATAEMVMITEPGHSDR